MFKWYVRKNFNEISFLQYQGFYILKEIVLKFLYIYLKFLYM